MCSARGGVGAAGLRSCCEFVEGRTYHNSFLFAAHRSTPNTAAISVACVVMRSKSINQSIKVRQLTHLLSRLQRQSLLV